MLNSVIAYGHHLKRVEILNVWAGYMHYVVYLPNVLIYKYRYPGCTTTNIVNKR